MSVRREEGDSVPDLEARSAKRVDQTVTALVGLPPREGAELVVNRDVARFPFDDVAQQLDQGSPPF